MSINEIEILYEDHTAELVGKTTISKADIFPIIDDSPLKNQLLSSFKFYYDELKKNIGHDLEPSFVFITSYYDINAFADTKNGVNIIGINIGTIKYLHDIFRIDTDLISTLKSRFSKFPANDVMFETAMHFTFYHELGHLIQKSPHQSFKLTEDVSNQFSLRKHINEFDADEFSSILIAGHVAQFSIDRLKKDLLQRDLEDVLVTISTSILFHLLSFKSSKNEIYYEECSHPHPIIRMVNIIHTIISHCLSTLRAYEVKVDIDPNKIVIETMNLAELINENFIEKVRLHLMRKIIQENTNDIDNYMTFLNDQKRDDKTMSMHKWNIFATSVMESRK